MSLQANDVTAGYGEHVVVRLVSLHVPAGQIIGLTGPSGCGKSTLARVMTGLLAPSQGEVLMDGLAVPTRRGQMTGDIGLLFQSPRRACDPRRSLGAIVGEFARTGTPDASVDPLECAREVGLTPDLLGRLPAEVSEGQLQRAALARALAGAPRYLVADEATAMLDAATTASVAGVLRRHAAEGLGVLAISHDHALLAAWADKVYDLRDLSR